MPYKLVGNCVYKGEEKLKCYDNHKDAVAYFRALKLNVKDSIHEFSMLISKASLHNGEMRWSAVNSDTDWDLYGERMSLELYKSMISKIKSNVPPPEPFSDLVTSEYWKGGMPYLSIAHYSDGNGKAVPGDVKELFIDGNQLKAKGTLHNSPLGKAVWKSLKEDEVNYKNSIDTDRIRISIAFLDLAHKHGEDGQTFRRKSFSDVCPECLRGVGEKIYLDGYLVHLALTRVPVNPRTIMEAEDVMARKSKIKTKKDDAVSILGDESLADEVEKSALGMKSEVLVEMSEADNEISVTDGKNEPTPDEVPVTEPESEPEVVEAKSMDMNGEVEQVQIWKPFGGATSMKDAKKYTEAQQESWRVSDLYYTFTDVALNIMGAEDIEDKAGALASLVDEFKKSLIAKSLYEELSQIKDGTLEENYMTVKKSEFEEVVTSIVSKAMDGYNKKEDKKKDEEEEDMEKKSVIDSTPVTKSALELSVDKLYNVVNGAIAKSGTSEDKLQEIQPVLEEVGQAIVNVVKSSVGEPQVSQSPANDAMLEMLQALKSQMDIFGTELATLKEKSINATSQPNRVPAPRSISPSVVKSLVPNEQSQENPNSVRSIARRSVGL